MDIYLSSPKTVAWLDFVLDKLIGLCYICINRIVFGWIFYSADNRNGIMKQ